MLYLTAKTMGKKLFLKIGVKTRSNRFKNNSKIKTTNGV